MANNTNNSPVVIDELPLNDTGGVQELQPMDRMRLSIALWVLGAILGLIVLAGLALLYAPDSRADQAKAFFEFVKTMGPPIVTLVIGFYFRSSGD